MFDGSLRVKLIIIGGVAGGASAAARARRIDESADILMVERGPDVSFANCGLPYHIGGIIPKRDALLVSTADRLRERFRLEVRTRTEAVAINRDAKTVRLKDLTTGIATDVPYDRVILAPGAAPIRPAISGVDRPNVFTLRTLSDTDRIKAAVDRGARRAVIVGGGFIGLELAENFIHRGLSVTLIDRNPQLLAPFDAEMTEPLRQLLLAKGVDIRFNGSVSAIHGDDASLIATMTDGSTVAADLIVLGIGVSPENQLAKEAGLAVGPRGGIVVDEHLRTSDPHIFAVGDAIETDEFDTAERTQIPLAGPANRQGRIAADNALGRSVRYRGTQGTAIIGVFDRIAAMTGRSEKVLRRRGTPYRKAYIHPAHHAGYYPGADGMTLKLLFEPTEGRILGAQGIGGAGVDKRIDIIAMAIQGRMSVFDLEESELCYAPQFGSAKDPVNMLGFVAAGLIRGDHPQIDWETVLADPQAGLLLDVRTPGEFASGHVPGAINIPVDELRNRIKELSKDRPIRAYCQVGQRGYIATRLLNQSGFHTANIGGGYRTYLLHRPH